MEDNTAQRFGGCVKAPTFKGRFLDRLQNMCRTIFFFRRSTEGNVHVFDVVLYYGYDQTS
jgi:hypothetical protein